MKLCIAEKPSVARDIAKVLGATTPKQGYMEGNGYCVTWTFGHLCTLKEPHDYGPQYKSWNLFLLPIIPANFGIKLIPNKGVENQFKVIERLVGHQLRGCRTGGRTHSEMGFTKSKMQQADSAIVDFVPYRRGNQRRLC
jgi:hypothetical protein